jgi:hypothetical protein
MSTTTRTTSENSHRVPTVSCHPLSHAFHKLNTKQSETRKKVQRNDRFASMLCVDQRPHRSSHSSLLTRSSFKQPHHIASRRTSMRGKLQSLQTKGSIRQCQRHNSEPSSPCRLSDTTFRHQCHSVIRLHRTRANNGRMRTRANNGRMSDILLYRPRRTATHKETNFTSGK